MAAAIMVRWSMAVLPVGSFLSLARACAHALAALLR
jgi:hypothetical protein